MIKESNIRESESMKKLKLLFIILIFSPQFLLAMDVSLGFKWGYREIKDPDLKEIYGDGYVYKPYLKFFPYAMWGLELSYEGGFKKEGMVGLFQEESTLNINGTQFCGLFRYKVRFLEPYIKFGAGYFSYQQDIKSQFVRKKVDHHKWTFVMGGGLHLKISKILFFLAELEYIPLKVRPFEKEVDLGGFRGVLGLGFNLSLNTLKNFH